MANIDRWFLRVAVIYALVAMLLGIEMGISEDHSQMPTHAHLNLVGWVSMAIYALVYRQWPGGRAEQAGADPFLDRQCRRDPAELRRLRPDGGQYGAGSRWRSQAR